MEEEPEVEPKKKEKKIEPSFEILNSPARVMVAQLKVLTTVDKSRYVPVKQVSYILGVLFIVKPSQMCPERRY